MAQNKAWRSTLSVLDDVSFKVIQDKDCGGHTPTRHGGFMIKILIRCH